ncbi:hypothetical protein BD414DRAFT_580033 [Trametes punicea]|nr:hypothetical protein BD414DRAFT_580033 [Trametes punicea]
MSSTILACSRVSRSIALTRSAARSLATESLASNRGSSPSNAPPPSTPTESTSRPNYNERTVYVRAWDNIYGLPAFFAMLRGVEKRFGRVRDFRVTRDYEIPTDYANFFMAEFVDDESFNRVPEKGISIKVEVPLSPPHSPGGVALYELQGLLQEQDWDPTLAEEGLYSTPIRPLETNEDAQPRTTRIVEVVIQRARPSTHDGKKKPKVRTEAGIAFYRWGGFYQPTSADDAPVPSEMRQVLEKWRSKAEAMGKADSKSSRAASARQRETKTDAEEMTTETTPTPPPESAQRAEEAQREVEAAGRVEEPQHAMDTTLPASQSPLDELPRPPELPSDAITAAAAKIPSSAATTDATASADTAATASASASEPAAASEPTESPVPAAEPERESRRLSQREKILMRARLHAKTPLPERKTAEAEEEEAAQRQAEEEARKAEQRATLSSIRDRLLKLMGGKWS